MPTRRAALSAVGLAIASLSGCLQSDHDDDGPTGGTASGGPAVLPEPATAGDREVVLITDTDLAALRDSQGKLTEIDGALGEQASEFVEEFPAFDPADVDRLTAQIAAGSGTDEAIAAVVVGDFDRDAVETWFSGEVGEYDSGEYGDYEWFAPSSDDEDSGVLAVSSDRLLFRAGTPGSDSLEAMATGAIDAASSDGRWYESDEHLSGALSDVEDHPNVAAASVASDAVAGGSESSPLEDLAAGAAGTTPRSDGASVDLVARFRSEANADAVQGVLEQFVGGMVGTDPVLQALEFEADGSVASASATVDGATLDDSDLEPLVRFLPFLYFGSLGSEPEPRVPRVSWDMEQRSDGRLEMVHAGGDAIESSLRITYQSDGETVEETWSEPDGIKAGDSYATERAGDVGTTLRVTWMGPDGSQAVVAEWTFVG